MTLGVVLLVLLGVDAMGRTVSCSVLLRSLDMVGSSLGGTVRVNVDGAGTLVVVSPAVRGARLAGPRALLLVSDSSGCCCVVAGAASALVSTSSLPKKPSPALALFLKGLTGPPMPGSLTGERSALVRSS